MNNFNLMYFLVLFVLILRYTFPQKLPLQSDPRCGGEVTCSGCIAAGPECAWCKQWDYKGPRCDIRAMLELAGCPPGSVYQKGLSELKQIVDKPFSNYEQSEGSRTSAVQVRPQKVQIALRPGGGSVNVTLSFRGALNYPLDLYFLMDLTSTMRDDKETLVSLVGDLASALNNLTNNFRIGFGSYVDKPVMPFVDQIKLENPCSGNLDGLVCSFAYGFQHRQSLSQNTEEFTNRVKEAPISGNLDNAEGGLDALVQTVVCSENIGWAIDSRKIVLMATDGILHFAGDGKLGGIVSKNDGECHLHPETGMYTMSTLMDYPSLGEMDSLLLKNKINVVFAVTQERLEHFMRLSNVLQAPTLVAALEKDSSNIIDLVRQGYQEIFESVVFSDNASSPIRLIYTTTCGGREIAHETSSCEQVEMDEELEFQLQIHLDHCPDDPQQWHQRIDVTERGLVTGLELDVDLLCGCSCEKEENSERCNFHGNLDCGVCLCHNGWYGETCSCTGQNATTISELDQSCLPARAALEGAEVCSGQGDCVCGRCECHGTAYGSFCQCDDSKCDRWGADGEHCGGPGRGRCTCGKCECESGWSGPSCSCATDKDLCLAPGDSKPCSGKGECVCGQCICGASNSGGRYTGRYCEKCDTCKGLCELYKACVLCKGFNQTCADNPEIDPCQTNSGNAYIDMVPELVVDESHGEEMCEFSDLNCKIRFTYRIADARRASLRVLKTKTCVETVNTAMFAAAIVAIVVILGLFLLVCWRGFIETKDRIAYRSFEAETRNAMLGAGENPIFKPATTSYMVPHGYEGPTEPISPTFSSPRSLQAASPF